MTFDVLVKEMRDFEAMAELARRKAARAYEDARDAERMARTAQRVALDARAKVIRHLDETRA